MNKEVQNAYRDWLQSPRVQVTPEETANKQKECQHQWSETPFPYCLICGISQDIWLALSNRKVADLPRRKFPY